ncbi:MAG: cysteine desulfurase family protein [Bacilli bacterium]
MNVLYFDYAASTPLHPDVFEAMKPYWFSHFANPSSIHQSGQRARYGVETARRQVASSIGAHPDEIVFTSGGTESDNLAIMGVVAGKSEQPLHIISSAAEHQAVLNSLRAVEGMGHEVTYLQPDEFGLHSVEQVIAAIKPNTVLISIMYVNNETGVIQPLTQIVENVKMRRSDIIVHTDAVQAYGVHDLNVGSLNVDMLSVSGHKVGAANGVGALYVRKGTTLKPVIFGGSQEHGLRAGSENVPAIVGFGYVAEMIDKNREEICERMFTCKQILLEKLTESEIPFKINGQHTSPHILSTAFLSRRSDILLQMLDMRGVRVSAGSACTAGTLQSSHVLESMYGIGAEESYCTIRISFGQETMFSEVEDLANILITILNN